MLSRPLSDRAASRLVGACFAAGLALAVLLLARSLDAGDQLDLLARGWLLAARGTFVAYGNPLSTGGVEPGGITSLLVGLPLLVWRDHRAPTVLILLSHVAAFLLLDSTLRRVLAPHERLLFAVLYWLNPWRLHYSSFLWNPNYLFLPGAVHLWSCLGQRARPRFWLSFWHAAILVLAFQIHASFLLLVLPSLLLWWRGFFKAHWTGGALGALLAGLPLVPWLLALRTEPTLVTAAGKGFLGRGLLYVYPLLRGLLYWLRYSSLSVPDNLSELDFGPLLGGSDHGLGRGLSLALRLLLPLTVLPVLLANRRLLRRGLRQLRHWRRRRWFPAAAAAAAAASDRVWLHGYVTWCLMGAVVVFCLAPTTIMSWQVVLLFHAAVLPLVLWAGALWRTRRAPRVGRAVRVWSVAAAVLTLLVALASPQYRCGGREDGRFPLVSHSPMFEDLGLQRDCPWPLDRPGGWWPDVLPKGN